MVLKAVDIQEIALAKASTLYCGEYILDWNAFAEAVSLCHILEERVKRVFPYQSMLVLYAFVKSINDREVFARLGSLCFQDTFKE